MKLIALAAVAALATTAGAASAQSQSPQAQAQPAPAKPVKQKKICKRDVPTGSMLPTSTCRTQQEWDATAAAGQDNLRTLRDRSQASGGLSGY